MNPHPQDRIHTIYLCRSPQVTMLVFLFLQEGIKPRAIARLEWSTGAVMFVEFPELPWDELQEQVRRDMLAFSTQYDAAVSTIHIPSGCSPETLLGWIEAEKSRHTAYSRAKVDA